MRKRFRLVFPLVLLLPLGLNSSARANETASQQWGANCSVHPGDACNATAFTACSPDSDASGEHVNDVEVTTTTPQVGNQIQVICHMGDGGDTDRDVWELWYNNGGGWAQVANFTDSNGCGAGVQNCTWQNTVTISGSAGTQALRCINHYFTGASSNACRTDGWFDVDEIVLTVGQSGSQCGNGTINAGEDCDGANLGGASCTSLGFDGGSLSCTSSCTFDTSACTTAQEPVLSFTERSQSAGMVLSPDIGGWHGTFVADYDQDGDEDLFMTSHGILTINDTGRNALFNNDGSGNFTEVAQAAGVDGGLHGRFSRELHGASWFDYDKDGDLDLFMPNTDSATDDTQWHAWDELYENNGNGTFTNVSAALGFTTEDYNRRGAVAGDFDGDGFIDLFVVNEIEYLNNQSPHHSIPSPYRSVYWNLEGQAFCFEGNAECPQTSGIGYVGWSEGTTTLDYDNDGDLDILVADETSAANDPPGLGFMGLRLWQNDGSGHFTNVAGARGLPASGVQLNGSVTVGDVDNDGDLDVYTTTSAGSGQLYKNNGSGTFSLSQTLGGAEHMFFADLDNDGDQDLVSGGVFLNNGNGTFGSNQSSQVGVISEGRGGMAFDADGDGDLDIVFNRDDRTVPYLRYYRNDLDPPRNYLEVEVRGAAGQAFPPGTKVSVYDEGQLGNASALVGYRELSTATGFVSGDSPLQHFGLDDRSAVDVRVRFPGGQVVDETSVAANTLLTVVAEDSAPILSNIQASAGETTATITWNTNESATSRVRWGTSAGSYPNDSGIVQTGVTAHSVNLTGLASGTTYHYVVESSDGINPPSVSGDHTFQTEAADTEPPVISNIQASTTETTAAVTWTTDEPSTSRVRWGTSAGSYPNDSGIVQNGVTQHTVNLTGLSSSTTYHYVVESSDGINPPRVSANQTLVTQTADTTPPVLSSITATNVTSSTATITWTSNEPSTSQVNYGTTTSYGSNSSLNSNLVTQHTTNLTGLAANTTYHYRVRSSDAHSNEAVSGDFTFTAQPSTPLTASQQWGANCSVHPNDACNATAFTTCSPDSDATGEHVNEVVVSSSTPHLGNQIQVTCHMGDGGDTDRDIWELWYNNGSGWAQVASFTDSNGCGAGVQNCTWQNTVTISGNAGTQALRCINHYFTGASSNACRTDGWFDVDEIRLTVSP
jgi:hypothetical protein